MYITAEFLFGSTAARALSFPARSTAVNHIFSIKTGVIARNIPSAKE